ncbi:DUF2523 family protein [Uliginosibacterium paludis]|uniref:DUF2523 family protein n=1 Tax=Uliginosibacterium paludis TaxID=1615952 RepID=A0ABV2CMK7_9RHOO|nr:DUF2523 family protein [Uliginosibacterium sp. 31-12]MDO6387644.1 DUF2523 family protein [Uliginosibacterium sp. 31-12]
MYGILLSALWSALAWVARSVLVKFVLYFGLFFITTEFIQILTTILPDGSSLRSAFGGLPGSMWWLMNIMQFNVGVPMVLSAYATRFIIRRIPVIG